MCNLLSLIALSAPVLSAHRESVRQGRPSGQLGLLPSGLHCKSTILSISAYGLRWNSNESNAMMFSLVRICEVWLWIYESADLSSETACWRVVRSSSSVKAVGSPVYR